MLASSLRTDTSLPGRAPLRGAALWMARITWLAVTLAVLLLLCASQPYMVAQVLGAENLYRQFGFTRTIALVYFLTLNVIPILSFAGAATIIFVRRSTDAFVLLVALMLTTFPIPLTPSITVMNSALGWTNWLVSSLTGLGQTLFFAFLFLFPDGRSVPSWSRWLIMGMVGLISVVIFVPLPEFSLRWQGAFVIGWFLILNMLGFVAQVYRYRYVSGPVERQQTKWVLFGVIATVVGLLICTAVLIGGDSFAVATAIFAVAVACLLFIPASLVASILRYRLWDIDLIANRALVYGLLTAGVIAIYGVGVSLLGAMFRADVLTAILATALAAIAFQPLRSRLQRAVNRLMYGDRDDPYAVLSRLGQRLETSLAPEAALHTIVETIAQALKLPYAAIALKVGDDFRVVAETDDKLNHLATPSPSQLVMFPLLYQSDLVGQLRLAPRTPGETFTPADKRLLDAIAQHAGVAAHNFRLTADLQRSRERLVTAREEERRRLRRDLHDGLGPTLASLTLKLDTARNLLTRDAGAADDLLVQLKNQTQTAIADIRRLVYDLRPPALDDLGLIPALQQHIVSHVNGSDLVAVVEAPDPMPSLPAAVEVAAYRIVQEALNNVQRHAQASRCIVRFSVQHDLQLEIADDGVGLPAGHQAGVGFSSMRERAEELGGACSIERSASGGTVVRVRLPLVRET